jgi:galactokinase
MTKELAARFADEVGAPPAGCWQAPGRVNLIGEHTDYNDGFVLPVAIDLRCTVAARPRTDGVLHVRSVQRGDAGPVPLDQLDAGQGWAAYPLGTAWALLQAGLDLRGADVLLTSDVPSGAGLSSSAALECAVAMALRDLAGSRLPLRSVALAAQRAEAHVVGAPVGIMDQMASLFGSPDGALLLDCRSLDVRLVPLGLDVLGLVLAVIDTHVSHDLAAGEYGARRRECEQAAALLEVPALRDATESQVHDAEALLGPTLAARARHVVSEGVRVHRVVDAFERRDVGALGRLFAASHASLRDDFGVSCPELDTAVVASLDGGAVAARMTGGGFGGSVLALVPHAALHSVATSCQDAAARAGHVTPTVRVVSPSTGAARVVCALSSEHRANDGARAARR